MSITLFKTMTKRNWVLLLIFFSVLTMYTSVMLSMYDPQDMEAMNSMLKLFPKDLLKAMGFSNMITDLTGYLAGWLYGMLMIAFPMVYSIILGNRLVAKMVDNGSFTYLLSTPNSRTKIIITQGVYALSSVALLFAALFGVGVLISEAMFPGTLDVSAYLKLNVTTMLVNMVVMMISFFFSCLFNETKLSLGLGSGIPIAFLLMNMLGDASEKLQYLNRLTIYGFYDPVELVHGGDIMAVNLLYMAITAILFASAVLVFKKKKLPL